MTKRILVIDDENNIREIVKISLELNNDWKVITVDSGNEGIAIAKVEQPDVILLDLVMPQEDGLTIFRKLQNNCKTQHIPVIFFTAAVENSELELLLDFGVKGILKKPFDPITLSNALCKYLTWDSLNKIHPVLTL